MQWLRNHPRKETLSHPVCLCRACAAARQAGAHADRSAFSPYHGNDLDSIFSIKDSRVVNHDNTVQWNNSLLQIQPSQFRISFAKCKVMVHQHLDSSLSVRYGPHLLGRFNADGSAIATALKLKKAA